MICYNDPASHPFITDSEKEYIQETLKCTSRDCSVPPTPWKAIFTSVPLWALICAQVSTIRSNRGQFFLSFSVSSSSYLSVVIVLVGINLFSFITIIFEI